MMMMIISPLADATQTDVNRGASIPTCTVGVCKLTSLQFEGVTVTNDRIGAEMRIARGCCCVRPNYGNRRYAHQQYYWMATATITTCTSASRLETYKQRSRLGFTR